MKSRHIVTIMTILFVLVFSAIGAFAQGARSFQPYPGYAGKGLNFVDHKPPIMPKPAPPSGICTDGQYLYVLQGKVIYQYALADLTLKSTAELPMPEPPPAEASVSKSENLEVMPKPNGPKPFHWLKPAPPSGICTDGQYLYVMHGKLIHQYALADLTLKNTTELPLPPTPEMEQPEVE